MQIFTLTKTALDSISPVIPWAQDTFIGTPLPDTYMVYTLISSPPEAHFDNVEALRSYRIQVSIFSKSGLANLPDVDSAMLAAGFQKSNFREIPRDQASAHFGLAKDYTILLSS